MLLEQDPKMEGFGTLEEWVLNGSDAPEAHEAAAIADQLGIELDASDRNGQRGRTATRRDHPCAGAKARRSAAG